MSLKLTIEQKVALSQNQIQSLKILEYDIFEMNDFLQKEYFENPFLEYKSNYSNYSMDKDFFDITNNIVAEQPDAWKNELVEQLNYSQFNKKEWEIILYLIDCLDENGYFNVEIAEIANSMHCEENVVRHCLEILSDLEPIGIFSANITECLLKQIRVGNDVDENVEKIIRFHLENLANGYISRISRDLQISTMQVVKYAKLIKELNPKPLKGMTNKEIKYIVPDVIAQKTNDGWEIKLNDNWIGSYSINEHYVKMMNESDDSTITNYFKGLLERSYFIIKSIEQRRITLQRITEAIMEKQKGFFEKQKELEPMSMIEIAEVVGINVSTVSRAVKNKYIQTNIGTFEMRSLFTTTVSNADGTMVNADFIKEQIKKLIGEEDNSSPYSDNKIVGLLTNKNINVARRTVAKYREEMKIPKASERKL